MDHRSELRDFLMTRRARLTPEQAGVPDFGGVRRVPGLRREEVAHLAGVSVDYYNRLERGKATGTSPEVLNAIASALQLDDIEREHLTNLTAAMRPTTMPPRRGRTRQAVRPSIHAVLQGLSMPAFVQNHRMEIIATNPLGHALYAGPNPDRRLQLPFSTARYVFLDPSSPDFYDDWRLAARNHVALLRQATGRDPDDDELLRLIGELSTHSKHFRGLWASHDVLKYREGRKRYHHPFVGDIEFIGEHLNIPTDENLALVIYTYEPNTPTAQAMNLLASWITTPDKHAPAATSETGLTDAT